MTADAWDTSILSRLQPGSRWEAEVERAAAQGTPVATTAHCIHEVAFGWALAEHGPGGPAQGPGPAAMDFLMGHVDRGAIVVLPFTAEAAVLAGRLRAAAEVPLLPPRHDRGHRLRHEVGWIVDLMIAATIYANGYAVRTGDQRHFDSIAALIATVARPGSPPLDVRPAGS